MGQTLSSELATNLKRKGYRLEPKPDNPDLQVLTGAVIDGTGWPTYLIFKNNKSVSFISNIIASEIIKCPVKASSDSLPAVNIYLTRINFPLVVGCFEADYSDGEVQFRTSIPISSMQYPAKAVEATFDRHVKTLSEKSAQLLKFVIAPPSAYDHIGVTCDGCTDQHLKGVRYKCKTCKDYDLCSVCMARGTHKGHPFVKYLTNTSSSVDVTSTDQPQKLQQTGLRSSFRDNIPGSRSSFSISRDKSNSSGDVRDRSSSYGEKGRPKADIVGAAAADRGSVLSRADMFGSGKKEEVFFDGFGVQAGYQNHDKYSNNGSSSSRINSGNSSGTSNNSNHNSSNISSNNSTNNSNNNNLSKAQLVSEISKKDANTAQLVALLMEAIGKEGSNQNSILPEEPISPLQSRKFEPMVKTIPRDDLIFEMKDGRKVKLGKGGFATVYKAKWLGLEVAVKEINMELAKDMKALFTREVSIMAQLKHPHVLLMLGICDVPPCVVLPLMKKGSLQKIINDKANIPLSTKIKYLTDSAKGMAFVHGNLVLHGDLKPLNILVDANDVAYVADFGLAKLKASMSGLMNGTRVDGFSMLYTAPEVFSEGKITKYTDVYSFAILIYSLLTYTMPFYRSFTNQHQFEFKVKEGMRPDTSLYPPSIPDSLRLLIDECWHMVPSRRPSFMDIIEKLESLNV